MIQGGSVVVSCDWTSLSCENLEFFLNLCLVLKQYITLEQYSTSLLLYFCDYHSFIILENIMENTGTVCTQVAGRSLPPGAITMVEVNLKRTFSPGEWEKGAAIKDTVIIVEKVGLWPMCALLNVKLQQKRTKRKRETLYFIFTNICLLTYVIFTNMCYIY